MIKVMARSLKGKAETGNIAEGWKRSILMVLKDRYHKS